jgi:hypothetical protein
MDELKMVRRFVAYWYFNGFDHLSFGIHFDWELPNIELHLPFGFFRIGFIRTYPDIPRAKVLNPGGFGAYGIGSNI